MTPVQQPLRCLAVRIQHVSDGQIDSTELHKYMDELAGRDRWISANEWLFVEAPPEALPHNTLPVVIPDVDAARIIVADLANGSPRVLHDHKVTGAEARRWRWLASQNTRTDGGQGFFPWEIAIAR